MKGERWMPLRDMRIYFSLVQLLQVSSCHQSQTNSKRGGCCPRRWSLKSEEVPRCGNIVTKSGSPTDGRSHLFGVILCRPGPAPRLFVNHHELPGGVTHAHRKLTMMTAFRCFRVASLVAALLPAASVLAAAPPAIKVGSQNNTIDYSPADTWYYANLTGGFSQIQGSGVFMFVAANADKAEAAWRTPSVYFP